MDNQAFFYLRNNVLRCRFVSPEKIKTFGEIEAVALLKEIDKNDLSIRIKDDIVVLTSKKENISIQITKDIFTSPYKYLARKTYKRLKRLSKDYMLEKYKNKEIKKKLMRGSLIAAGPLAAIIIGVSIGKPEKTSELDTKPVTLEFNVQDDAFYISSIKTDDDTYLAGYDDVEELQEMDIEEHDDYEPYIEMLNEDTEIKTQQTYYGDVSFDVEDKSQDEDVVALREKYAYEAQRAEERWGIDSRLILAMLTQESHGRYSNLMQIQFSSFADEIMTVYNFEEQREMKIVFTNNPSNYAGKVDMTISQEEMKDPGTLIKCAAMIMNYNNYNSSYTNVNVTSMLIIYNQGPGGAKKIFNATPGTREDILGNPNNTEFTQYTYVTGQGDPDYVNNVTQYLDQSEGPIRVYSFLIDETGDKAPIVIYYTVDKTLSEKKVF